MLLLSDVIHAYSAGEPHATHELLSGLLAQSGPVVLDGHRWYVVDGRVVNTSFAVLQKQFGSAKGKEVVDDDEFLATRHGIKLASAVTVNVIVKDE